MCTLPSGDEVHVGTHAHTHTHTHTRMSFKNPYPWSTRAAGDATPGAKMLQLYSALVRTGCAGLQLGPSMLEEAAVTRDEPLTRDRPAASVFLGRHSTRRTLTYNTVAEFDPVTGAFAVPLGGPPHLYRGLVGLLPQQERQPGTADEAAAAEKARGFCVAADGDWTTHTHCSCVCVIQSATVEDAHAEIENEARDPILIARGTMFRDCMQNSVRVAPVLYMRRSATALASAVAADTPVSFASYGHLLRLAWFDVHQNTAFAASSRPILHAPTGPAAAANITHTAGSAAPAVVSDRGDRVFALDPRDIALAYRDTYATLQHIGARGAPATIFQLPYGDWPELMALARMDPASDLLDAVLTMPATTSRARTLLLACHIYSQWRSLVPSTHWRIDNVLATQTESATRAFNQIKADECDGSEVKTVNEILRGNTEALARIHDATAVERNTEARNHLARVRFTGKYVIHAARDLRETLYPTWDATRGGDAASADTLWLRWHVNPMDGQWLLRTELSVKEKQSDGKTVDWKALAVRVAAKVRICVAFVHCPVAAQPSDFQLRALATAAAGQR